MDTVNRSVLREKYQDEKGNDERIFVVPTEDLPNIAEGFVFKSKAVPPLLIDKGLFVDRYRAEFNQKYRQPIPYLVVHCGDKVFATKRLEGAGESRLHGKVAMGVGGHINPQDVKGKPNSLFNNTIARELFEELKFKSSQNFSFGITFMGLINDTSNDVGKDHLGLVYLIKLQTTDVEVKETDKYEGGFYSREELLGMYDKMENWSKFVFDAIELMSQGKVII